MKFTEKKLVIASHNKGKIREISELLRPYDVEVAGGDEFDLDEPEENGSSFLENAGIKSRYFTEKTGLPALADDSGLCVKILDGAPGIYSARWAGESKDFSEAMKRVQLAVEEMIAGKSGDAFEMSEEAKKNDYAANFTCALSLTWPNMHTEQFEGHVHGHLTFPPKGDKGFGYDPIFIPEGHNITFGEMPPSEKHKISHRADAFNKLITSCF